MTTPSPWQDEYWWVKQRATAEEFGVPDPDKVLAQVNEICATRLDKE